MVRIAPRYKADGLTPDKDALLEVFSAVEELTDFGDALAVSTPGYGATAEAIFKMTVGNQIGVKLDDGIAVDDLFAPAYGSFIIELADNAKVPAVSNLVEVSEVGETTEEYSFVAAGETLDLAELQDAWEGGIESVFPYRSKGEEKGKTVETMSFDAPKKTVYTGTGVAKPHVIIPVFPGNNCEYDSAAAFERAGADVSTLIVNNLTPAAVAESTAALVEEIKKSQIIMILAVSPAATNRTLRQVHHRVLPRSGRDRGRARPAEQPRRPDARHLQRLPGAHQARPGAVRRHRADDRRMPDADVQHHRPPPEPPSAHPRSFEPLPVAGEDRGGRHAHHRHLPRRGSFRGFRRRARSAQANGQIATQYVDEAGVPGMDLDVNPNGSLLAIEGITSPDGRVFGKMGHSERYSNGTFVNVPGEKDQPLFAAGVEYFAA